MADNAASLPSKLALGNHSLNAIDVFAEIIRSAV